MDNEDHIAKRQLFTAFHSKHSTEQASGRVHLIQHPICSRASFTLCLSVSCQQTARSSLTEQNFFLLVPVTAVYRLFCVRVQPVSRQRKICGLNICGYNLATAGTLGMYRAGSSCDRFSLVTSRPPAGVSDPVSENEEDIIQYFGIHTCFQPNHPAICRSHV